MLCLVFQTTHRVSASALPSGAKARLATKGSSTLFLKRRAKERLTSGSPSSESSRYGASPAGARAVRIAAV